MINISKLKRGIRLYRVLVFQFFKVIMQSKADFFIGLIGFFLKQIMGIVFLYLVFRQIPDLMGWSFDELVFIYGFAQIPRGIDHLFTDNLWLVAKRMIINGDFDRYMLRPMNVLFQIISEKLQPDALGELLVGSILIVRSITNGTVVTGSVRILFFVISVITGAFIYSAIKLFFASFAFWMKRSGRILQVAYEMADFAKYPTEIYSRTVRFIITWIIPFAFVAFLPASYFLNKNSCIVIGGECLIALIFSVVAYSLFCIGIHSYESAGN